MHIGGEQKLNMSNFRVFMYLLTVKQNVNKVDEVEIYRVEIYRVGTTCKSFSFINLLTVKPSNISGTINSSNNHFDGWQEI